MIKLDSKELFFILRAFRAQIDAAKAEAERLTREKGPDAPEVEAAWIKAAETASEAYALANKLGVPL